jgi:hypothetical protein
MALDEVRLFWISMLVWIRAQQRRLLAPEPETPREFRNKQSLQGFSADRLAQVIEGEIV